MPVVAIADMFGISGRRAELQEALGRAEGEGARQPGCLRYTFAATIGDPDHYVLLSEWQDQAALEAHYASAAFARFQFALGGLLARPSEMTVYAASGAARPLASGPMDPRDAD
jgi:quinol monooxygenase YgiN